MGPNRLKITNEDQIELIENGEGKIDSSKWKKNSIL